jgi:hypothetical protein
MENTIALTKQSAINTAHKNATRDRADYSLQLFENGKWLVDHNTDVLRAYVVDMFAGTCTCPQFGREAICKHWVMVSREIDVFAEPERLDDDTAALLSLYPGDDIDLYMGRADY